MTLQSLKSRLVGYSFFALVLLGRNAMVTQAVVVNSEGALRSEEHGYVGVVGVTDSLAVQSFLDQSSDVSGVVLSMFYIVHLVLFWVRD